MITDRNEELNDKTLEYAISIYLRLEETKEGMLQKFGGNKTKLVQFLRERAFTDRDFETPSSIETDVVFSGKILTEPAAPTKKKKRATKKKSESNDNNNKNQKSIF